MSNNLKAGIRFTPDIYAEIGYDSQNETGEMAVIGANGETIWESGSGGSSVLSIANVTITTTEGNESIYVPVCLSDLTPDIQGCLAPNIDLIYIGTRTYQIALFKGYAMCTGKFELNDTATQFTSVSGSATLINPFNVLITGDCTLAVKKVSAQ